jgi:hypothetical protein
MQINLDFHRPFIKFTSNRERRERRGIRDCGGSSIKGPSDPFEFILNKGNTDYETFIIRGAWVICEPWFTGSWLTLLLYL